MKINILNMFFLRFYIYERSLFVFDFTSKYKNTFDKDIKKCNFTHPGTSTWNVDAYSTYINTSFNNIIADY